MRLPRLLVAALAAGLVACGGGRSEDERAQAPTPSTGATTQAQRLPDPAVRAELVQRRLYVGFQDDPSFRWRPDRGDSLTAAARAGATVIRTTVQWQAAAPRRPARAAEPFDPAYRLDDLDELVRNAQLQGLEVLITIWGTPSWANGGVGPNRMPRHLADLTDFAHALADRYSGRHAGYPFVRFFTVWNEPNLQQFLAPQFDADGRSLSPALYARLFEAAAAGIRSASPHALIAAGTTSPRGRDRHLAGIQDSHAPATFARLVAEADPELDFDAWAHHPYPTAPRRPPTQMARWPNVALQQVRRLGESIDEWFDRSDTPIWVTEYAYETRPADEKGVIPAVQARYAEHALRIAAANPRIEMFVWFTFRDDRGNPWQSGLLTRGGRRKPAYRSFARQAQPLDARVEVVALEPDGIVVRLGVRPFAHFSAAGAPVGVVYRLYSGRQLAASSKPQVRLERDGWITVKVPLDPQPGERYRIGFEANDRHGNVVSRELVLVGR